MIWKSPVQIVLLPSRLELLRFNSKLMEHKWRGHRRHTTYPANLAFLWMAVRASSKRLSFMRQMILYWKAFSSPGASCRTVKKQKFHTVLAELSTMLSISVVLKLLDLDSTSTGLTKSFLFRNFSMKNMVDFCGCSAHSASLKHGHLPTSSRVFRCQPKPARDPVPLRSQEFWTMVFWKHTRIAVQ